MESANNVVRLLASLLAQRGLTIAQPFPLARYHGAVQGRGLPALEDFGRADTLSVLVGSTRALWPRLVQAAHEQPALAATQNPVDDYTALCLAEALPALPVAARPFVAREEPPVTVSLLHAAEAAGFASVGPSWLAVHPELGPWFGLRAVVTLDAPYEGPAHAAPRPCAGCSEPCRAPFERARGLHADGARVADHYEAWLAVRDACPVGQQHRYGEPQLRYHYTKDLALLRAHRRDRLR